MTQSQRDESSGVPPFSPRPEFYEGTMRGDLAWRIAQRVADAQRNGRLETKEIRNAVEGALLAEMAFEFEHGRHRFVTKWVLHPVDGEDSRS